MKYLKLKFLLMFFALAMAIPPAWAETVIDFQETFDQCSGTGGNDGAFSGTGNNNIVADNEGWTFTKGNGANKCAKFGTGSAKGNAATPWITVTPGTTYTLTFKIGGWSGDTYQWIYVDLYGGTWSTQTSYNLSVNYSDGQWTECSYTFTANDPTIYINFRANNAKNNRFFLDEVVVSHEENTPPSTDPWVTVNPSSLTINDVVGDNNKFDVSARNIRDWQNLSVTPNNGFSVTGTSTTGNTWYNENGNTGFYSNSEHSADGTVTVAYGGLELSATGEIECGTKDAESQNVEVSYRSDIYIVGDYLDNNGWGFANGTLMSYENGVYTKTITVENPGTCIMFARTTGNTYGWNNDRLFFSAKKTDNWDTDDWVYGTDKCYELEFSTNTQYHCMKFNEAGDYTITINASDKTFSIVSTNVSNIAEAQDFTGRFSFTGNAVVTYHNYDQNGVYYTWIRDVVNRDGEVNSGLIKGSVDGTFTNGDVLKSGWKATKNEENTGIIDFINPEGLTSEVNNGPVAPYELTTLTDDDLNKYVSMSGLTVTRVNSWQYTVVTADGTNTFYIYDQFHVTEGHKLEVDKTYNVVGVVSRYNGNPQLYLISAEEVQKVETPTFEPAAGTYYEAKSVTIACETQGATIHYTTDGSEPTATSAVYSTAIPVSETTTIKAIAMKEGWLNSSIAEAVYTIKEHGSRTKYTKVTNTSDLTNGNYLIVYEGGNVAFDGSLEELDATKNTFDVEISSENGNNIIYTDIEGYFTINVTNGTIKSASNKYIGRAGDSNGLDQSDEALTNTISMNGTNVKIEGANGAIMRYNTDDNQQRFRYYKSSSYSNQKAIQLYKEVKATPDPVAAPTFNPEAGTYTTIQNVEISCATEGAKLHYLRQGREGRHDRYRGQRPVRHQPADAPGAHIRSRGRNLHPGTECDHFLCYRGCCHQLQDW